MALESGQNEKRFDVPYLDGVNATVGDNIAQKMEFIHAENARSKIIGTVEKREGQKVIGTNPNGSPFVTSGNSGLFFFDLDNSYNTGLYRVSIPPTSTLNINVYDDIYSIDIPSGINGYIGPISIWVSDMEVITESINGNNPSSGIVNLYYLNSSNQWIDFQNPANPDGALSEGIQNGQFNTTFAENCMFMVNYNDLNRYIVNGEYIVGADNTYPNYLLSDTTGTLTVDSNFGFGHLYGCPQARKINYYKGRLYVADFYTGQVEYKNMILRSSYTTGLATIMTQDLNTSIPTTDGSTEYIAYISGTSYFQLTSIPIADASLIYGFNWIELYRGITKIADIYDVGPGDNNFTFNFATLKFDPQYYANSDGNGNAVIPPIQAADELWLGGTHTGPKYFVWPKNSSGSGTQAVQYGTFQIGTDNNDSITMMENIGNVMMIANHNVICVWNDYLLQNFDMGIGCASLTGYAKMLGNLYFIHYTGIYATSGAAPQLISEKVKRYIEGATVSGIESAVAGTKDRSVFFMIGTVNLFKPDGSVEKTLYGVCLEYNTIQQNWFVHTNVYASNFTQFADSLSTDHFMMTGTTGNLDVIEFLSGENDNGNNIFFRVDTPPFTLQSAYDQLNNPESLIVETLRGTSLKAYAQLDNDPDYYPLDGEIAKGLSVIKINNKDGGRGKPPTTRKISISIRDSSKQLCKISRMSIIFTPTNETVRDNDQASA